jgi:hypothetical protein
VETSAELGYELPGTGELGGEAYQYRYAGWLRGESLVEARQLIGARGSVEHLEGEFAHQLLLALVGQVDLVGSAFRPLGMQLLLRVAGANGSIIARATGREPRDP